MILCSVSLTIMAAHLSALLILSGLSGIQSLTTVSRVSVRAGVSISVPCLYESKYTNRVKYLCEGYYSISCSYADNSKTKSSSAGVFSISDDKQERVFTVTIAAKTIGNHHYWCAVEINDRPVIRTLFELSVTKDQAPALCVTIHFRHSDSGLIQWCRLLLVDSSCVEESTNKEWEGLRVTVTSMWKPRTVSVTLNGLKSQSSGWYFLSRGDQKLPVHITVKERLSTNTPEETVCLNTSPSTLQPVNLTCVPTVNTTGQAGSQSLILPVTFDILMFATFFLIIWIKDKQTKTPSPAAAVADEEVTHSDVLYTKQTREKPHEHGFMKPGPDQDEDVFTVAELDLIRRL